MCVRDIEFTYFYDFSIECWNCSDSVIYIFFILLQVMKKTQLSQNEILPNLYQMVTCFNLIYNIPCNSFKLIHHVHDLLLQHYFTQVYISFLFQLKDFIIQNHTVYNAHLNHRRIFIFSTPCGVGSLLCMRNTNCKPH